MLIVKPSLIRLVVIIAILVFSEWSCQTDARTTSRIPPAPASFNRKEWRKEAFEALDNLIKRKIDLDNNLYKRARLYFEQDDFTIALADINKAIEINDNIGEYYLLRGKINRELNKQDAAMGDALRAEGLQQDTPDLYILLADVFQEKKQFRESQQYLITALQMAPYDGDAYYVKGMLLAKMADTTASLVNLSHALTLNPRMIRAYKQLSNIYSRLGNYQQALEFNNSATLRFPTHADLYYDRGNIYKNAYKLDSAIYSYRKAIELDSSLYIAHYNIGTIYLKWKSYPTSLASFENVLKYQKKFPQINFLIALCYEKVGNDDKAAEYYTQEMELNPEDQQVAYALQRIQNRKLRKYDPAGIFANKITEPKVPRAPVPRTLDTSRIKITTIQPRRTLTLGSDSTRKVIIK